MGATAFQSCIVIESAEGYALAGMQETLARNLPTIIIEVHSQVAPQMTFHELGKYNYQFIELGKGRRFGEATRSWIGFLTQ
jgi:hypothetical protein